MSEHTPHQRIHYELGDSEEDQIKLFHDLRNLISPILIQSQLLMRYAETPESKSLEIKKSADAIDYCVRKIVKLLEQN